LHPTDPTIAIGGSQDNGTSKYSGTQSWTLLEAGDGGLAKFSPTNPLRLYHQSPSFGSSGFFRRSDDGGLTWFNKVNGITDLTEFPFYATFVVDSSNGDRVLLGGKHVWETVNGGDSWQALGIALPFPVRAIGIGASDVNTVYAASGGSIFVTTNHGATWTERFPYASSFISDIQVDPTTASTAYVVVNAIGFSPASETGKILKTKDFGATWTDISGNFPGQLTRSLQIYPAGRALYVGADDGVYVSTSDGLSWRRFATPGLNQGSAGLPHAQVYQIDLNTKLGILAAGTHGRGMWEIKGVCGCDINADRTVDVRDVQSIVNQVLGTVPVSCDVNSDGTTNILDVQIVVNAVLAQGCNHL
jgi:photosystem II stability/assembly factor-like uncharacterized protein